MPTYQVKTYETWVRTDVIVAASALEALSNVLLRKASEYPVEGTAQMCVRTEFVETNTDSGCPVDQLEEDISVDDLEDADISVEDGCWIPGVHSIAKISD